MARCFKEITTLAADLDLLATRLLGADGDPSPARSDLVRFATSCRLDLFRTLHLLVKDRWEALVLDEKGRSGDGPGDDVERLTSFEEGALARLLDRFRMVLGGEAIEEIHRLLERHGGMASALGYDRDRLSGLVDQMILSRVHYCGAGSDELGSFVARQEHELALLRDVGREEQYRFWLKKSCWLAIQRELEDKLLLREDLRLKHHNVTLEWMALFGSVYLQVLEAQALCHKLERRIALRRADPTLGDEELDRRVKESLEEELASIERAKQDALQAAALASAPEGRALFDDELDRYLDEAKKLIREIWRLTHPDALDGAFTEQQREKLRGFFERVVKIRKSEAHLDVRAIPVLKEILARVKELYDVMGIDLEPESVIRGDTLAEKTAWLEAETRRIEVQIQEVMAEIQAMSMDPDVQEKLASMADEEAQDSTLRELERLGEQLRERGAALETEYRRVLEEVLEPATAPRAGSR